MHTLARKVRFSVNPFLPADLKGSNSYASKPAGEGLAIFLELSVELAGTIEQATGFIVNVVDIDEHVQRLVVPLFSKRIREDFRQAKHIGLRDIAELLKSSWGRLAESFESAKLSKLTLALNPFRNIAVDRKDCKMIYFSEKFEFAATHQLWNDEFSAEQNMRIFGKCANPAGHGHNYIVEVVVKMDVGEQNFCIVDFEETVSNEVIKLLDHKNLNTQVAEFSGTNPTVENIVVFVWEKIVGKFSRAQLHCVTVWETDKTYCSYYGSQDKPIT
jgi:6-pyruvoyltetrahydropterin/6-carboxytetrahydropterin synthase